MISAGHSVDYYGSFGSYPYQGWQADTAAFNRDPLFDGLLVTDILLKVKKMISATGSTVRVLRMNTGETSLKDEEFVQRAPMFEHAFQKEDFARHTRKGVIRHWKALNDLWHAMKQAEFEKQVNYTHVIYHKGDFLWMRPFQFDKVFKARPIAQVPLIESIGRHLVKRILGWSWWPEIKAYTQMCQSQYSSWIHDNRFEVTEFVIIFERAAANYILGDVYNELLSIPTDTAIEVMLARMASSKGVSVNLLPAAMIPGQLVGNVGTGGAREFCLHKTCNSCDETVDLMDLGKLKPCPNSRNNWYGSIWEDFA
eukprot:gnl/TRDRNA2_/TRDRNA2_162973_c0_seq1.p1 gnl/TRDRNA2_/TRDRNA2_162973_c0~~gnl/TRDRNA2_/TRDRNA2_162973_c0_seq1.p1  ORF type:complete len:311 (-),score=34.07 gnl/TRDRNA2_/TRDRNA2_162973_c0_seq1:305-1237(-)